MEPKLGKQVHGEVTIARTFGSTGDLSSGFWRIGPTSPGAQVDGSHRLTYSAPLGDETACVVDGTAVLTVTSTAKTYKVGPGSIISSQRGWKSVGRSMHRSSRNTGSPGTAQTPPPNHRSTSRPIMCLTTLRSRPTITLQSPRKALR